MSDLCLTCKLRECDESRHKCHLNRPHRSTARIRRRIVANASPYVKKRLKEIMEGKK